LGKSDDNWYHTKTDRSWYQNEESTWFNDVNEESVWFDANEDLEPESEPIDDATENTGIDGDSPIYEGAPITVNESASVIMQFATRHNLTGEGLADFLTVISLHCITQHYLHKSLYRFRSFFSSTKAPLVNHQFCSNCDYLLEGPTDTCPVCACDFKEKNNTSYFVQIPFLFQIQEFFKRSGFHKDLMHMFSREKKADDNIEDIYDGELYQEHSRPGCFLDSFNNLSFMWYTDGVPLFKSSKISLWPLFLSINELPILERFKTENMLFGGLWFGRSKPSMACFLKPFHDSLTRIRDIGYEVFCVHCSTLLTVRGMLLCGTCDLPAKCMVLNMIQFNGKHGCTYCTQEGVMVKTGVLNGQTRVYPFDAMNIDGPKRNHKDFIRHGDDAFASAKPSFGVKGSAWLANCCPDIINGTGIDYMHAVLLGLVRRLLKLWFDPKFSKQSFSISKLVDVADKRLSEIKPPYYITRHPRNIKEQSKYWKASECRAWLFFYSVPVLFGLLEHQVFQHYLLLVEAVYILNLDSISAEDLTHCEELLIKFNCTYSGVYGDNHMSANLHQMLHLHNTVKQLGPLWVYSCFSFESMNGKLVRLFHGTQNPVIQIANAVSTMLKMPALSQKLVEGSPAEEFHKKLSSTHHHFKVTETIFDGAYLLGRKHLTKLDVKYVAVLSQCVDFVIGDCYMFYRILLKGILYHSVNYNTYSRNSCTVVYKMNGDSHCGQIMYYVKVYPVCHCCDMCKCSAVFLAVVKQIVQDDECAFVQGNTDLVHAKLDYVYTGKLSSDYTAVPIDNIVGLGVAMNFSTEKVCVVLRPNTVESD
jgi:hypothetical protein